MPFYNNLKKYSTTILNIMNHTRAIESNVKPLTLSTLNCSQIMVPLKIQFMAQFDLN